MPPEAEAFSKFTSAIGVISSPSSYGFQKTAYQGGQGTCPPEAEAFSKFRYSKGVIFSPSAYGLQKTAYQGGQGAWPLKLKHFLNLDIQSVWFLALQPSIGVGYKIWPLSISLGPTYIMYLAPLSKWF